MKYFGFCLTASEFRGTTTATATTTATTTTATTTTSHALADCNQCIQIRKKMQEFSFVVLHKLSLYLLIIEK